MKTIRFFKTMSMALVCVLMSGLVSCGDDDEPEAPSLSIGLPGGAAAPTTYEVPADGGSQKFAITSNGSWQITLQGGSTDWITVSPLQGNDNGEITITVARNTDTNNRSATLSFAVNGTNGVKTYPVSQLGFGANIAVSPNTPEEVVEGGADVTFTVTTNADAWEYAIANEPAWITQKEKTATTLILTVAENSERLNRTANITFKLTNYQTVTQVVVLTQSQNTTAPSYITLGGPDNATQYDMARAGKISFGWTGTNIDGGYVLMLNNSNNFENPALSFEIDGDGSTKDVSTTDIDKKLAELGVANSTEATLYWTVKPKVDVRLEENTAVKNVKVTRVRAGIANTMVDVIFKDDGSAQDVSGKGFPVQLFANETYPIAISFNSGYNRNVVKFNPLAVAGGTGSYYRIDYWNDDDFKAKLSAGHTFECLVQSDHAYDGTFTSETKFFSTHEGGGTGFLITHATEASRKNVITFLPNIPATDGGNSNWLWTPSDIMPDGTSWYHLVGVWNKEEGKTYLYVNGEKKGEAAAVGFYRPPTAAGQWLAIGGDAGTNIQGTWKGSIGIARIFDKALTADEAVALWNLVK